MARQVGHLVPEPNRQKDECRLTAIGVISYAYSYTLRGQIAVFQKLTRCFAPLVCALTVLSWGTESHAWGNDGHKVIALIAKHFIEEHDSKTGSHIGSAIADLLSTETTPSHGTGMVEAATWADDYRSAGGSWTREWHFADIEIEQASPNLAAACFGDHPLPAGTLAFGGAGHSAGLENECVVNRIDQFQRELANKTLSRDEREYALLFLLHFVGDLHQPLHASDNHDRGGNEVPVVWGTNTSGTNLHSYWDTNTVHRIGSTPELVAAALIADIRPTDAAKWSGQTPVSGGGRDPRLTAWALESFGAAKTLTYGRLSTTTRTCKITKRDKPPTMEACRMINPAYAIAATGQARKQLQKAGVRLAALLIESLK